MKYCIKILFILLFLSLIFLPKSIEARSGCCSYHGGVCGCGCCDGSPLSAKCAPYYPCNTNVETIQPTSVPRPTAIPTKRPTPVPTRIPTIIPTNIPTPTLLPTTIPTLKPTKIPTPTPTPIIILNKTTLPELKNDLVNLNSNKKTTSISSFFNKLFSWFFK